MEWLIDQFLLQRCQKKDHEWGYDIRNSFFSVLKYFGFIILTRSVHHINLVLFPFSSSYPIEVTQSVISDSTISGLTEVEALECRQKISYRGMPIQPISEAHLPSNIVQKVSKLQNLCSRVETDFVATKNDMGNLQVHL